MTDTSLSPVLSLFPPNISSSLSSDSSRSFYWMTDASLSPILSLLLLNISQILSSNSNRSFYRIADAPSISDFLSSIVRPMSLLHVYPFHLSLCSPTPISSFESQAQQPTLALCPACRKGLQRSTVYSQLCTQSITLFRLLLCLERRKYLHPVPFAHYGLRRLHTQPIPFIPTSSLPQTPEGLTPCTIRAIRFTRNSIPAYPIIPTPTLRLKWNFIRNVVHWRLYPCPVRL
ncbi:hypothetical protein EDB19DRAFT_819542 [Suillus lakei]|nr:hypothetical protein EDB19DRAFT_819542 [Suillus lakei]